jgi:hypothetical protein
MCYTNEPPNIITGRRAKELLHLVQKFAAPPLAQKFALRLHKALWGAA